MIDKEYLKLLRSVTCDKFVLYAMNLEEMDSYLADASHFFIRKNPEVETRKQKITSLDKNAIVE
jgi:hypothetical protein